MARWLSIPMFVLAFALASCGQAAPAADQRDDGGEPGDTAQQTEAAATDGGGDDAAGGDGGGDGIDGCLLTAEEVSAALDAEVADATAVENPGLGAGCSYNAADNAPVLAISIITNEQAEGAFESYREYEGAEEISGIGDAALYLGEELPPGVAFIKDGVVVSLGVPVAASSYDADELAAVRSALEDLARIAADRL